MTAHRQIHLDFHTPAGVTVGDKFTATEFFDTLEAAKVNSIAVFAKCHHGYSYFDTKVGTRHPGLGFDLLGQMVAEGAKRQMPVQVTCNRPDSVAVSPDGRSVAVGCMDRLGFVFVFVDPEMQTL